MKTPEQKPKYDDSDYPGGGAKVGDAALLRLETTEALHPVTVYRVGVLNDRGYHLDIEVQYNQDGKIVQVDPFECVGYPRVLVFVPQNEIPQTCKDWMEKVGGMTCVREINNGKQPRYVFMNAHRETATFKQKTLEYATLYYDGAYGWTNGKWDMDDCEIALDCGGQTIKAPSDFELDFS